MSFNLRLVDWQGCIVWLIGVFIGIGWVMVSVLYVVGVCVVVLVWQVELLDVFVVVYLGSCVLVLDVMDLLVLKVGVVIIGLVDLCVYCVGYYWFMSVVNFDFIEVCWYLDVNYGGVLNLFDVLLLWLLLVGWGYLSLVFSVVGYCGLFKVLVYGLVKVVLMYLVEVFYFDLYLCGIGVLVVYLGFVIMLMMVQNDFCMLVEISFEQVVYVMLVGWVVGCFEIYFFKCFMLLLKVLCLLGDGVYFGFVSCIM